MARLLVIGASGSGTSSLGRALATGLASQHFDIDDFFWQPTEPPFTERREVAERVRLMQVMFLPRATWVASGSPMGWGDVILTRLTHVVFVTLDPGLRLARLEARERLRLGARIAPGGDRAEAHRTFLDWARSYDDPTSTRRSRATQEAWLYHCPCPVLRLDGDADPGALAGKVIAWLDQTGARP